MRETWGKKAPAKNSDANFFQISKSIMIDLNRFLKN